MEHTTPGVKVIAPQIVEPTDNSSSVLPNKKRKDGNMLVMLDWADNLHVYCIMARHYSLCRLNWIKSS